MFHGILSFPSYKSNSEKKYFFKTFNISENNIKYPLMSSIEACLWHLARFYMVMIVLVEKLN